jgi:hypothetical protein
MECPICFQERRVFKEFLVCVCGLISTISRESLSYDEDYVASRYGKYTTGEALNHIRYEFLDGFHGTLLDIGYGDGSFLKFCEKRGWKGYGYDINPTDYGVSRKTFSEILREPFDVITLFDSLEHMDDFSWVKELRCKLLVISTPYTPCDFPANQEYKHYRPLEHFHYFNPRCLIAEFGNPVFLSTKEDHVRGTLGDFPNILTMGFLKAPS